jgi:hypothetical protein
MFSNTTIPSIKLFADLREALLRHDDQKRRWPKWQFMFAQDLAIQVQPQAEAMHGYTVLFKLRALEGRGIRREHFRSDGSARQAGLAQADYEIRSPLVGNDAGAWRLRLRRGIGRPAAESYADFKARADRFEQRVLLALRPNEVGELNLSMLSHYCLICGRALTDPISMARLIGPECADNFQIPTIRQIQVAMAA